MTMTAKQAAQELGLSARKLYELAASGKLACYRFDGAVRFESADIEVYRQSCRSPATTQANGFTSLTASSPDRVSALIDYFRQAGQKNKRTSLTASKPRVSTPLQLVSPSPSR